MALTDYQVHYANHAVYVDAGGQAGGRPEAVPAAGKGHGKGHGPAAGGGKAVAGGGKSARPSAVRLFTNLPGARFVLPAAEGYRFCRPCGRFVHTHNRHCTRCGVCPSNDGRPYVHCELCRACVKPGRAHCVRCARCLPPGHACGAVAEPVCHVCGVAGHRRAACPQRAGGPPS